MYRLFCPKGIFFLNLCFTSINSVLNTLSVYKYFYVQEKKLLFPEMRVTRKIFTRVAVIFFSQFSGGSLFSSLASFVYFSFFFLFFDSCVFCLYCCCFLKLKMHILIHIWLCGQVSDNIFSPGWFPETRILFLAVQKTLLHTLLLFVFKAFNLFLRQNVAGKKRDYTCSVEIKYRYYEDIWIISLV